jgi:hypothetical protein
MLMCTMLHKLAGGTPLQQCRMNNVQWKQRARLITGLGTAVMIFILLCTVACGGGGDGSLAKGGISMIVVSGQATIQSGGGNTSVVEGQEAVLATDDQIMAAADGAGVKLLLVDGSLLDLKPGTDLQVVAFSAEGTTKLRLKGRLEVQAASPLLTIEVSTSGSEGFALKTIQFTATPTIRETAFGLWIDGLNAYLTVEAGEVNVTKDNRTETIPTGSEVKVTSEGLIVSPTETPVGPTAVVVATDDLAPTPTATAAATPTPEPLFPAPGLVGPGDGSNFKPSDDILLIWDTRTPLSEDEWYEVQLWREGDVPYTVAQRTKEGTWKVERRYYPGSYQWRILIVRGQEGERDLSRPSQTWSFSWLSPVVQAPTAPPSSSDREAPVDLTVYLRGTNNAQGLARFSGEHVDAGAIYSEGSTVYGDVAVRIGDTVYHFDKEPAPGEPEQLPDPYRLEVEFSDSLIAATEGIQPGFNPQKAQFWVGTLNCNSAVSEPYRIEMTLYAGGEARKHTEISFLVADDPLCGGGPEPDEGGGGGKVPPPR